VGATAVRANNDDCKKEGRRNGKGIDIHQCEVPYNFSAVVAPMVVLIATFSQKKNTQDV